MKNLFSFLLIAILSGCLFGCATAKKVLPLHDEVLIYELPYDLTYLRTLEALDNQSGWVLDETEKEKGIIRIRNVEFSRWDDADLRSLTFNIKRIDRSHTSIALAPESQRSLNGGDMLKVIGDRLKADL